MHFTVYPFTIMLLTCWTCKSYQPPPIDKIDDVIKERRRSSCRQTSLSGKLARPGKDGFLHMGRFYFKDKKLFDALLISLNRRKWPLKNTSNIVNADNNEYEDTFSVCFESVGYANVAMRMCHECRDVGKPTNRKDQYFVDMNSLAQERTVLCYGCLGKTLYTMQQKRTRCTNKNDKR